MSPAASWLTLACVTLIALLGGALRYGLAMRRRVLDLERELAEEQRMHIDVELGLRDTRMRRRQLEVIHGEKVGTFTRYGRRAR